jgi:hypothetical protein
LHTGGAAGEDEGLAGRGHGGEAAEAGLHLLEIQVLVAENGACRDRERERERYAHAETRGASETGDRGGGRGGLEVLVAEDRACGA